MKIFSLGLRIQEIFVKFICIIYSKVWKVENNDKVDFKVGKPYLPLYLLQEPF